MYCAAFSRAVPPVRVVKATQRDAMDPRVDTDASTPLSQWNAPRPWWIGADASGTGNYGTDGRDSIQVETRDNDRLDQPCSGAEAGGGLPQDRRSRDPRKIFGDLPNSSYDTGLLGDPITRELEQREANRRRPTAGPDARTWFDTGHTMSGSVPRRRSVDNRRTDQVFWREEFNRLEDQLTTLSLERERWERDRRQLLDQNEDRARDLGGIRRVVEAQSQLVMESLVAAQRLAAAGAPAPRTGAPLHPSVQTAWVHPNVSVAQNVYDTSPSPWLSDNSRRAPNTSREQGGTSTASRRATEPDAGHRYFQSGLRATEVKAVEQWDQQFPSPTMKQWQRRGDGGQVLDPSLRSTAMARVHGGPEHTSLAGGHAHQEEAVRDSYAPVGQGVIPTAIAPENVHLQRAKFPRPVISGSTGGRDVHSSTAFVDSRDTAFVQPVQIADATPSTSTPVVHVRGGRGWQRVDVRLSDRHGASHIEGGSEVWEWNGRVVMLQRSQGRRLVGQRQATAELRDEGQMSAAAAATAVAAAAEAVGSAVPSSLLSEMEDVTAAAQALAGSVRSRTVPRAKPKTVKKISAPTEHAPKPTPPPVGHATPRSSAPLEVLPSRRISFSSPPTIVAPTGTSNDSIDAPQTYAVDREPLPASPKGASHGVGKRDTGAVTNDDGTRRGDDETLHKMVLSSGGEPRYESLQKVDEAEAAARYETERAVKLSQADEPPERPEMTRRSSESSSASRGPRASPLAGDSFSEAPSSERQPITARSAQNYSAPHVEPADDADKKEEASGGDEVNAAPPTAREYAVRSSDFRPSLESETTNNSISIVATPVNAGLDGVNNSKSAIKLVSGEDNQLHNPVVRATGHENNGELSPESQARSGEARSRRDLVDNLVDDEKINRERQQNDGTDGNDTSDLPPQERGQPEELVALRSTSGVRDDARKVLGEAASESLTHDGDWFVAGDTYTDGERPSKKGEPTSRLIESAQGYEEGTSINHEVERGSFAAMPDVNIGLSDSDSREPGTGDHGGRDSDGDHPINPADLVEHVESPADPHDALRAMLPRER